MKYILLILFLTGCAHSEEAYWTCVEPLQKDEEGFLVCELEYK